MLLSVDILDLILYCFQQLGVMLSVGGETVVLIAYIVSMRDGVINDTETRFSRAVHRAIVIGIVCIVLSGAGITVLHGMLGQTAIIFEPVFLFKWLLIAVLIAVHLTQKGKPFSNYLVEGALGATWYALFLVHILAPITSWINLAVLYIVLLAGFEACWFALVKLMTKKLVPGPLAKPAVQKQKVAAVIPPTPPKPIIQQTPVLIPPPPAPHIVPKPAQVAATPRPPIVPATPAPKPVPPLAPVVVVAPKPLAPPVPVVPRPIVEPQKNLLPTSMPLTYVPPAAAPAAAKTLEPEAEHSPWLPAIHVMPKSQADLEAKKHVTPMAAMPKRI